MNISIVIPAYNEAERIIDSIKNIVLYFKSKKINFEIIVVDDGSTDNTVSLVRETFPSSIFTLHLLKNEVNKGKGFSVKRGILSVESEFILFTDADLSTPIEEFDKLFYYIEKGFDIVIASRGLGNSKTEHRMQFHRKIIGTVYNRIV